MLDVYRENHKNSESGMQFVIGMQVVVARALALLLLYASFWKVWLPRSTEGAFQSLFGLIGVQAPTAVLTAMTAGLVLVELLVASSVLAYPRAMLSRVGLLILYTLFLCIVCVFAVWSPGSDCGCGMPKVGGEIAPVVRSTLLAIASVFQFMLFMSKGTSRS
jgi:hypothetical protein